LTPAITTDEEREPILSQNNWLFQTYPHLFQRLRRCAICLANECAEPYACQREFQDWQDRERQKAVIAAYNQA
jgi:hypothetical protein